MASGKAGRSIQMTGARLIWMFLTAETVETFRRDGVVVLRAFLPPETVQAIAAALDDYIAETVPRLSNVFFSKEADGTTLRGLFWLNIFSPFFAEILDRPALSGMIEGLEGWTPRSFFAEAFMKPAHCGGTIPLHQDIAYSAVTPHQQATIWAPIDPVRANNGAVRYLAGSHKVGLLDHGKSTHTGSSLELLRPEGYREVQFDLNPGDVLVHDGLVMHDSGPNRTCQPRRAVAFGYRGIGTGFERFLI